MDTLHVSLDGHVHEMAEDEHTVCGLPVPYGVTVTTDDVDCPAEVEPDEKPKAKAKGGPKA